MTKLCWTQVVLTCIAVVATLVDVETIIWSGPAMAILGLLIAILSIKRDSIRLLAFGLMCPIVTSLIALLIATFRIGPGTASSFVWALLTLNAIVTVVWWLLLRRQVVSGRSANMKSTREPMRYSILHMLIGMTIVSLLLAIIRPFIGLGEMTLFAAYGVLILTASLAILLWFASRSKKRNSNRAAGAVGVSGDVQP